MRSNCGDLASLFDAVPVGVAVLDADTGAIRSANDAFCDLFGCERAELPGRSPVELAPEGWTPAVSFERRLERAREGAEPTFEWRCRAGGGEDGRRVEAVLSRVDEEGDVDGDGDEGGYGDGTQAVALTLRETGSGGDESGGREGDRGRGDGRPSRGDDGNGRDRSPRDPPPTPLSEAELRAVYHSVHDAIYVHDESGAVIDANRRAAEMYGYPRERLREGAVVETSAGEPPYTAETAIDRLRRASEGHEQTFEWRGQDSEGNEFWEEVTMTRTFVDGEVRVLAILRDVDERKRRERELREQNDRLQALFANSRAAIVEYVFEDGEPKVESVNDRFEEVFGYDAGTVVGRSVDEFIVPPEGEREAGRLNRKVERGEYLSTEVQRRTADGVRSFLLRNAPIDTEEETRGYASYTDITERKQRERELREQREKYSTLVEQSHEGVVIVQDKQYRFVNSAMTDLTGYSKADLVGRRFTEIIAPEYHDLVERRYERRVRGETPPQRYDIEVVTADDERRHIDLAVSSIQYEGAPATLGTFNDITERKQREQELEDLNARLQLALDETDTGVWEWDLDTDDLFWDDGSKRLFGYEADDFLDDYGAFEERVHPDDIEEVRNQLDRAIATGDVYEADFRIQLPDGDQRWVQSRGIVEYGEDGDPERMFGVQTDITDRKQFERSLEDKNKKLELLNRIVRHDIRNDMTVARGRAEVLEDYLDEGPAREHLQAIVESADHVVELTEIVRDLMTTMLEEEDATDSVALAPVLAEELDAVRSTDEAVLDAPETVPPVAVEADEMLGTVFRNLLANAVRHNDTDDPHVSVSVTDRDDEVLVRVADDGPGVPDGMKDDIFGRGEKGLESPGTGVGLYLVDTLVDGYGGEVWVEDNDPRGAVFAVRLPKADSPDDATAPGAE